MPDDLLVSGPDRAWRRLPRRAWLGITATAVALAGVAVVSDVREKDAERRAAGDAVRLAPVLLSGSGSRADGQVFVVVQLTSATDAPLRLRRIELFGGGVIGEIPLDGSPLDSADAHSFDIPVRMEPCPDAVTTALRTRVRVTALTALGDEVVREVAVDGIPERSLRGALQAARLACDRPAPWEAATVQVSGLRLGRDQALMTLTVSADRGRAVEVRRVVDVEGLAWRSRTPLPQLVPRGETRRVVLVATTGDCSQLPVGDGLRLLSSGVGVELGLVDDPTDSYREPPQTSFLSTDDAERLVEWRDERCGLLGRI